MCTASESACIWRASLASGCGCPPRVSTTCWAKTAVLLTSALVGEPMHARDRLVVECRRAPGADPGEAEREAGEQVEHAGEVMHPASVARAREPQCQPDAHQPLGRLEELAGAPLLERAREPAQPALVDARHRELRGHGGGLDRPQGIAGGMADRR